MRDLDGVGGPAFLRLEPPELDGTTMVVHAVPETDRARRRNARSAPLGYLYERDEGAPDTELRFAAGHYDETELVWSFSGDVLGVTGITQPTPWPGEKGPAGQ